MMKSSKILEGKNAGRKMMSFDFTHVITASHIFPWLSLEKSLKIYMFLKEIGNTDVKSKS